MLGKNLKNFTETFARQQAAARRSNPLYGGQFNTANLKNPSPENLAAHLDNEIMLAEAIKRQREIENVEKAIQTPDIVDYIESKVLNPDEQGKGVKLEPFQKQILRHLFTIDLRTGQFPYTTIIWSAPKKTGKTATVAFATCWLAEFIEAPNVIMVAANNREQAAGRIFGSMSPTLEANGAEATKNRLALRNGTIVKSITNSPTGEAGASYLAVVVSELWGWDGERAKTFWAETKPVPTRLNSMRIVESYVGYEDKSAQMLQLWKEVFTDTSETKLQDDAEVIPELANIRTVNQRGDDMACCYRVPKKGLFLFVDHSHRVSWLQGERGERYFATAFVGDTDADIMRLKWNYWQKTENPFIKPDMLTSANIRGKIKGLTADGQSLFTQSSPRFVPPQKKMTLAIDASQGRIDTTALAGVYSELDDVEMDSDSGETEFKSMVRFSCAYFKAYEPTGEDFDLDELITKDVVRLWKAGMIKRREPDAKEKKLIEENGSLIPISVYCDITQLHQIRITLRKKHNLLIKEFPQGNGGDINRLKGDTFAFQLFKHYKIDLPDDATLNAHLTAARAELQKTDEIDARLRIVKPTTAVSAIDGAVALAMAVFAESLMPPVRRRKFGSIAVGKVKGL